MEEIKAWKTSDGEVFKTKYEAKIHEDKLKIKNKIDEFVDSHYFPNMTRKDLSDILTEFYNEMP